MIGTIIKDRYKRLREENLIQMEYTQRELSDETNVPISLKNTIR